MPACHRRAATAAALAWLIGSGPVLAQSIDPSASLPEEEAELRERLTEREDKRRPAEPFTVFLGRHPLTLGGEAETLLFGTRHRGVGDDAPRGDRLLSETGVDVEAFYTIGPPLAAFVQLRFALEEDLLSSSVDDVSEAFVERGEMWLYSEGFADSPFEFDIGRLDFDDDRTFWWDEELDTIRASVEVADLSLSLAFGRELLPARLGRSEIEPEQEGVVRVLGELGWDWRRDHALEIFGLYQTDHSRKPRPGESLRADREDESDARLTWLGLRAIGASELRGGTILGYWLDLAGVRGRETLLELEAISPDRLVVSGRHDRDVSGWALDLGGIWILPWRLEPRFFAGFALGSGDPSPDSGTDRAFRQTGLHANESGFGGVERFASYGILLEPELSNLQVLTLGIGFSLLRSSSLDVVFHDYRQLHRAPFLRDAGLDASPDGRSRRLGQALDVVLAIEEWERFEIQLQLGAFRAGEAFAGDAGRISLGASLGLLYAF